MPWAAKSSSIVSSRPWFHTSSNQRRTIALFASLIYRLPAATVSKQKRRVSRPAAIKQDSRSALVPIVIRLVRTFHRNAQILRLLRTELRQLHADLVQVQPGDFLIQ